jgi:hypothetical protein
MYRGMDQARDVPPHAAAAVEAAAGAADSLTRWVNIDTAAEWIGLPVETVHDAIAERELPAVNSHPLRPGRWMVRLGDLQHWAGRRT